MQSFSSRSMPNRRHTILSNPLVANKCAFGAMSMKEVTYIVLLSRVVIEDAHFE